ncbi:MAG TPA: mercuric transporter MerT family protein [Stellaceae bacterium]|nr:mercuric transporter MerT family protein [Stellaceae bacterium]
MSDLSNISRERRVSGTGAVLLTLGGLTAAFGVAACCALPLLLTAMGVGAAWLGGIALLAAPHRLFLLAAASLCFAGAAVLLWRQHRALACTPGVVCARPAMRGITVIGLVAGLALLCLGLAYA